MTQIVVKNLYADVPQDDFPEELFEVICTGGRFSMERIISRGHVTPDDQWYDQAQDEWVVLLTGSAQLMFDDGQQIDLVPGDYVLIKAHHRHRVIHTSAKESCVWLAIHHDSE